MTKEQTWEEEAKESWLRKQRQFHGTIPFDDFLSFIRTQIALAEERGAQEGYKKGFIDGSLQGKK